MVKSGILYKRGGRKSGELSVSRLVVKLKALAWSLRWAGLGLILLAVGGIGFIFSPLMYEETRYYLQPPTPQSKLGSALRDIPNWQPPNAAYSLYIPKIRAISQVIANVPVADEKAYLEALKQGVAEAAGLSHPGQPGTTYLFAHSTDSPLNYARYNAVFYLLNKLEVGDWVEVMYQGKLHRYKVAEVQVLEANDTRYLTTGNSDEILVLQTCYPPGTSWKRLVVVARRQTRP